MTDASNPENVCFSTYFFFIETDYHQWDHVIFKSPPDRMVTEIGVQPNCKLRGERASKRSGNANRNGRYPEATDKRNSKEVSKKWEKKKKYDILTDETSTLTASKETQINSVHFFESN